MNNGTEEWKVSNAEFKGFMKAKLEGIEKSINSLCGETKNQDTRLNKVENRLTATEVKGGIFGFIGGIIGGLFRGFIK